LELQRFLSRAEIAGRPQAATTGNTAGGILTDPKMRYDGAWPVSSQMPFMHFMQAHTKENVNIFQKVTPFVQFKTHGKFAQKELG